MMKKRMKALLAIGLSAIIMVCSAGCGNGKEHMKAETDPDIPVEDVSFPLKEKAELSFITSGPVLYRISLMIKKIWRWHSSEIFRMDFLTQG